MYNVKNAENINVLISDQERDNIEAVLVGNMIESFQDIAEFHPGFCPEMISDRYMRGMYEMLHSGSDLPALYDIYRARVTKCLSAVEDSCISLYTAEKKRVVLTEYVGLLVRDFSRRAALASLDTAKDSISHSPVGDIGIILDTAIDAISKTPVMEGASKDVSWSDCVGAVMQGIKDRCEGVKDEYIPTGSYNFDKLVRLKAGRLYILAGRPGIGKSAVAVNWLVNMASSGKRCLFFAHEMNMGEVVRRMCGLLANVDVKKIEDEILTEAELDSVSRAAADLAKKEIMLIDDSSYTVFDIERTVRSFKPDVVFIDHLHCMPLPSGANNKNNEYGEITRSLKGISKKYSCPVICLAQLNRGLEARTSKRPVTSDLRESGAIEQDADAIIMAYREDYYDGSDAHNSDSELELIITKHRHGPVGVVKQLFFRNFCKIIDYVEKSDESRYGQYPKSGDSGKNTPSFRSSAKENFQRYIHTVPGSVGD